jgi:hypothetical protein
MARDHHTNVFPFLGTRSAVVGFFLCFFILMSSGRMGSYDAGQQLSAATLVATQHTLGSATPPSSEFWVRSPNGLYYEPHDLGALLLMLPSAWIGSKLDHSPPGEQFVNPPLISKVGVSLTYAAVCAIGCFFLFLIFAEFYPVPQAFLVAFVFAAGSYYLPYAKVTWDVAPCAASTCVFLYYVQRMLRPGACIRAFAVAGFWLAIVCTLRYSIAPALVVALVFLWWRTRGSLRNYLTLGAVFAVCMVPSFIYNAARTGSFLRPATASAYYLKGGNSMNGDIVHGFMGLLFGANRGLIVFSPIVLLGLCLPWIWRRLQPGQRALIEAMSLGALLYTLMIAKMDHWGAFGWGARYLLPCLPIIFLIVGPCLIEVTKKSRLSALIVVLASVVFNVAPATTNWHVIVAEYPGADLQDSSVPYAVKGIWVGFWQGLHGEPLSLGHSEAQAAKDNDSRRFPDFWTAKLMDRSRAGRVAGWVIVVALLAGMALALWKILWAPPEPERLMEAQVFDPPRSSPRPR